MASPAPTSRAVALLLGARAVLGLGLVWLSPVASIDEYFRPYHAAWWWAHPSFASSGYWLPGYGYVFGPLMGLTESVVAIRLVNLAFHLGAGWLLARAAGPRGFVVAAWFLFSPLSIWLGQSTLSEPLFVLCLVVGATQLASIERRAPLVASAAFAACALVRYDGWFLLPGVAVLAAASPDRRRRVPIALLPFAVPLLWMAYSAVRRGDPLYFLTSVEGDQFEPPSLVAVFSSPAAWLTLLQAVAAATVAARFVVERRSEPLLRVASTLAAWAAIGTLLALATGNLPSQGPLRLAYPLIVLGAIPFAARVEAALAPRTSAKLAMGLAAAMGLSGVAATAFAPSAISGDVRSAVTSLQEAIASGALRADEHVLVEGPFPESTAVVVLSAASGRVHLDGAGRCGVPLLRCEPVDPACAPPSWRDEVGGAVVADVASAARLRALGWRAAPSRGWTLFFREGAPLPCPR